MSRKARIHSPGALAHITAHSIEDRPLFVDNVDRQEFLSRFEILLKKTGYECDSWSLMDNHYHLFVRTNENPMSDLMRPLNGGYAQWYNKRHKRHGYLFQDRFHSSLCHDSNYAKVIVRYIHLNPLKAKIVGSLEELEKWPWCGHGHLLGNESARGKNFQKRDKPLHWFDEDETIALKKYMEYMNEGLEGLTCINPGNHQLTNSPKIGGAEKVWPLPIGDHEYVKNAMLKYASEYNRRHHKDEYENVMRNIAIIVTEKYSIQKEDLITRKRRPITTIARQAFCKIAFHEELLPMAAIARYLRITIPAVSKLTSRQYLFLTSS